HPRAARPAQGSGRRRSGSPRGCPLGKRTAVRLGFSRSPHTPGLKAVKGMKRDETQPLAVGGPESLLVVACFSRHPDALAWGEEQLQLTFGPVQLRSADYDFHHTRYYEPDMGPGLRKRL